MNSIKVQRMLWMRRFDEEGTRLFKAGKIPRRFQASIGQDVATVGALNDDDSITGTYRSYSHPMVKGPNLKAFQLYKGERRVNAGCIT